MVGSIHVRITLLFLVPLVIASGWIGWRSYAVIEDAVTENAWHDMRFRLNRVASSLVLFSESARRDMLLTLDNTLFVDYFSLPETKSGNRYDDRGVLQVTPRQEEIRNHLELWIQAIQKRFPVVEVCLIDTQGQEHLRMTFGEPSATADLDRNEHHLPFFSEALKLHQGESLTSDPYFSHDAKRWVYALVSPVALPDGGLPAIYHYEIPLSYFQNIVRQEMERMVGVEGEAASRLSSRYWVMDGTGRVVADSNREIDYNHEPVPGDGGWSSFLPAVTTIADHPEFLALTEQMRVGQEGSGSFLEDGTRYFMVFRPLHWYGWSIGHLRSDQALLAGNSSLEAIRLDIVVSALLILFSMGWVAMLLSRHLSRPLRELAATAHRIAEGDLEAQFPDDYSRDEIGALAGHLQEMKVGLRRSQQDLERIVDQRTQTLQETNARLLLTVEELSTTREELIHSEKMASLGRLVAGFAHEINTPIGIAIGSVSQIPETIRQLEALFGEEEVDGGVLDKKVAELNESSRLMLSNLTKAADIVSRFKRTSLDQSSENERMFKVREVIDDVILSVHNRFKNTEITIRSRVDGDWEVLSHPGALGQVLTNFLLNSLVHGFDHGTRPGKILILATVRPATSRMEIRYRDDGQGMSAEVLKRIFEPFFTTARQTGGSGLGMYICYNIVKTQLHGSIHCGSHPGEGIEILVEFPVRILALEVDQGVEKE